MIDPKITQVFAIALLVLYAAALVTNAIGSIRGTFEYTIPEHLITFFRWCLSVALGLDTAGRVQRYLAERRNKEHK